MNDTRTLTGICCVRRTSIMRTVDHLLVSMSYHFTTYTNQRENCCCALRCFKQLHCIEFDQRPLQCLRQLNDFQLGAVGSRFAPTSAPGPRGLLCHRHLANAQRQASGSVAAMNNPPSKKRPKLHNLMPLACVQCQHLASGSIAKRHPVIALWLEAAG